MACGQHRGDLLVQPVHKAHTRQDWLHVQELEPHAVSSVPIRTGVGGFRLSACSPGADVARFRLAVRRYNNIISIPCLVAMLLSSGEHHGALESFNALPPQSKFAIFVSGVIGFSISYTGETPSPDTRTHTRTHAQLLLCALRVPSRASHPRCELCGAAASNRAGS
jgi:hypothetical protein